MFDHATLHASDRDASEAFYDTVLVTLGIRQRYRDDGRNVEVVDHNR